LRRSGAEPRTGAVTQVVALAAVVWACAGAPRARPPARIPAAMAGPLRAVTMRRVMVVFLSFPFALRFASRLACQGR
jgi:hypothetical protein